MRQSPYVKTHNDKLSPNNSSFSKSKSSFTKINVGASHYNNVQRRQTDLKLSPHSSFYTTQGNLKRDNLNQESEQALQQEHNQQQPPAFYEQQQQQPVGSANIGDEQRYLN